MLFRVGDRDSARFLMWQLNARSVYEQASQDTVGSTSPHVNVETIRNLWLARPPLAEQKLLADRIDSEETRISALRSQIDAAIGTLGEYRAALISAAVTGKIDVRGVSHAEGGGPGGQNEVDPGGPGAGASGGGAHPGVLAAGAGPQRADEPDTSRVKPSGHLHLLATRTICYCAGIPPRNWRPRRVVVRWAYATYKSGRG